MERAIADAENTFGRKPSVLGRQSPITHDQLPMTSAEHY